MHPHWERGGHTSFGVCTELNTFEKCSIFTLSPSSVGVKEKWGPLLHLEFAFCWEAVIQGLPSDWRQTTSCQPQFSSYSIGIEAAWMCAKTRSNANRIQEVNWICLFLYQQSPLTMCMVLMLPPSCQVFRVSFILHLHPYANGELGSQQSHIMPRKVIAPRLSLGSRDGDTAATVSSSNNSSLVWQSCLGLIISSSYWLIISSLFWLIMSSSFWSH